MTTSLLALGVMERMSISAWFLAVAVGCFLLLLASMLKMLEATGMAPVVSGLLSKAGIDINAEGGPIDGPAAEKPAAPRSEKPLTK